MDRPRIAGCAAPSPHVHDTHRSKTVTHRAAACVTIRNRLGLHARPATAFAQLAMGYESSITVRSDADTIDGKSVMQILMLGATRGSDLEIEAVGADADDAIRDLKKLVEEGFGEE